MCFCFCFVSSQFTLLSSLIQRAVQEQFADLAQASRACARLVTSEGTANDYDWPKATIASFELYAAQARERARMETVMYLPVVTDLPPFNDYMLRHENEWVTTARHVHVSLNNNIGTTVNEDAEPFYFENAVFDIVNDRIVTTTPNQGPYMPVWQWSPPPQGRGAVEGSGVLPIGKQNFGTLPHEAMLLEASRNYKGTSKGQENVESRSDGRPFLSHPYPASCSVRVM